jgi:STE24 endopeptidase
VKRGAAGDAWIGPLCLAVGFAAAGAWVLGPRDGPARTEPVRVEEYFSPADLARARAYARPQLALGIAGTVVRAAVVWALVRRRPRARPGRRPVSVASTVAGGVALSVGMTLASLPVDAARRKRSLDVGLATQSWRGWGIDVAKGSVLKAALAGAGAPVVVWLMRRHGEGWWIPAAAGSVVVGVVLTMGAPVVVDPIFDSFRRLEPGETRDDVLALAEAAGVGVRDVYTVDASRRTTAANAYVTGLGATRRVVLFDTLVSTFSREETRIVVAHELAHVRHRDVLRGLMQLGVVAPAGMRSVARLTRRLDRLAEPGPRMLPALALAVGIVATSVGVVSNRLSRAVERRADEFALELTDAPEAFTSFEQRIVLANLGDPDPPRWFNVLLATHPPAVERIAAARAHALSGLGGAPAREAQVVPVQDPLLGA